MHSPEEVESVLSFIKSTPEGNLRKMLVSGDLTEAHFRILMKLAKGGPEADFTEAFQNDGMAKLRLSTKESPLKEKFWAICKAKFQAMGLLPAAKKTA